MEKEEFHDLRRLKKLRIDGNQLSVIVDNLFIKQRSLEFLGTRFFYMKWCARIIHFQFVFADLSRNRLAKVTNDAFNSLINLTYLDLSYNKLVKLEPASMEPLKNLHTLNISGNMQMDLLEIRNTFQVSASFIVNQCPAA